MPIGHRSLVPPTKRFARADLVFHNHLFLEGQVRRYSPPRSFIVSLSAEDPPGFDHYRQSHLSLLCFPSGQSFYFLRPHASSQPSVRVFSVFPKPEPLYFLPPPSRPQPHRVSPPGLIILPFPSWLFYVFSEIVLGTRVKRFALFWVPSPPFHSSFPPPLYPLLRSRS